MRVDLNSGNGWELDRESGERMKYYDEEKMVEIRKMFETEVLAWKGVSSRPMMGCLCYFYNRKFIGFLVTDGIVLMKLSEKDQTSLKEKLAENHSRWLVKRAGSG